MDLSAHPHLLEALNTTAAPEKARNRVLRAGQSPAGGAGSGPLSERVDPEQESA
jgi:hypothetical protein